MTTIIDLKLYKNDQLIKEYKEIKALEKEDTILFFIEDVKTSVSKKEFIRENKEYQFKIDFRTNTCTYLLKENNTLFDINVEKKTSYKKDQNKITIIYKIETEEELIRVEIERKEEYYA